MAKIILSPGEIFKHCHSESSFTILLKGKVKYTCNSLSQELQVGEVVVTPKAASHMLENFGDIDCIVKCSHGSPPEKDIKNNAEK